VGAPASRHRLFPPSRPHRGRGVGVVAGSTSRITNLAGTVLIKAIGEIIAGQDTSTPSPVHDELVDATQLVTAGDTKLIEASISSP
jgi:hypothetical protein